MREVQSMLPEFRFPNPSVSFGDSSPFRGALRWSDDASPERGAMIAPCRPPLKGEVPVKQAVGFSDADLGRFNLWRPTVVERIRGSKWQSALPTGSRWVRALPTGSRWLRALPGGGQCQSALPTSSQLFGATAWPSKSKGASEALQTMRSPPS